MVMFRDFNSSVPDQPTDQGTNGRTNRWMDGRTAGQTHLLMEMRLKSFFLNGMINLVRSTKLSGHGEIEVHCNIVNLHSFESRILSLD